MKKILVTGATGFVGRSLIPYLVQTSYSVRAAVRNPSNLSTSVDLPAEVELVWVGDLSPQTDWRSALTDVNTIIHLAARAHILQETSLNPKLDFYRINTESTSNLVRQASIAGVKQFIFISSIGAMTTLSEDILTEDSSCSPDTAYGLSKLRAEHAVVEIASKSSMEWTILRPTLVYGPRNPGNMGRLFDLVDRGIPLPFASIHNRRSLIYVHNLVNAIITCINNPKAFKKTFILSDGEDVSTPYLIRRIARSLDRPVRLIPIPVDWLKLLGKLIGRSIAIDRLVGSLAVDISCIRNTLNWNPPHTLDNGLKATANWYLDRPSHL